VLSVKMDDAGVFPAIVIGETIAHVAGWLAAAGVVVTLQVRFTAPVNPPEGVTVIVPGALAPAIALSAVAGPLRVKLGRAGVTLIITVALEPL
jgi:hypothetical protein